MGTKWSGGHGYHGRFIVIEGPDGVGKTTQAKRLAEFLVQKYPGAPAPLSTFEPTYSELGKLAREHMAGPFWYRQALLLAADCDQHLHEVILPAMAQSRVVIGDRYTLSSEVYQSIAAFRSGSSFNDAIRLISALNQCFIKPDLTLVLLADSATERRAKRAGQETVTDLFDGREFQKQVEAVYRMATLTDSVLAIDASPSEDEVFTRVSSAVCDMLEKSYWTRNF